MIISKETAVAKFKEILGAKGTWGQIAESQFGEHLAVFASWALRQALWEIERSFQEFFRSTASVRSSILAHVEDENYIPIKALPSAGDCAVTNLGAARVELSVGQQFESPTQVRYVADEPIELDPGESVTCQFRQATREVRHYQVDAERSFFEILFDTGLSGRIFDMQVFVDGDEWILATKFQNVGPEAEVFDEFYSHTDQSGIRFGNGIFGKVPGFGSEITVVLWVTDGDTYLADGQRLEVVGEALDNAGNPVDLSVMTVGPISGGAPMEDKESIRRNLQYWPLYNRQLVWDEDYKYYLRRQFPAITWVNVWGEREAEEQAGAMDLAFINTIFVSAYAGGADIEDDVIDSLEQTAAKLNRRFQWVAPVPVEFSLAITGQVSRSRNLAEAEAAIRRALTAAYGADSPTRADAVRMNDIYSTIQGTGYFSEPDEWFSVTATGDTAPGALEEFVAIALGDSTVELTRL